MTLADLPPCECPPEAIDHDDECARGAEIDRRTAAMSPQERLAVVRGQD